MNNRNEHIKFFVDMTPETTPQAIAGIFRHTQAIIRSKREEIKRRRADIAYRRILRDITELTKRI